MWAYAKSQILPSLGARIAAAIMSYQLGHSGVDRALKEYAHIMLQNSHRWILTFLETTDGCS